MSPHQNIYPALAILCLLAGGAHAQDGSKELTEAREAVSIILNAASDNGVPEVARRNGGRITRIFSDLADQEDTDYTSVTILFGDGKLKGDVEEDLFVLWGDVELNGRVKRDCATIFGSIKLGPQAELLGDTRVIGGRLIREPGSVVKSQPVELGGNYQEWPVLSAGVDWFQHGVVLGRPMAPGVMLSWFTAGLFFLAYVLTAVLFPRPVQGCVMSMRTRPASSFLMGILLPILVALIAGLLAMTGVGILVVPFLLVAFVFATVLGKAAVMQFIGQRLGEAMSMKGLQRPGMALFVGGLILCLLYVIPIVGILVWGVTLLFAMGAAMLATIDSLQAEGSELVAEPVPDKGLSDSTAMIHIGPADGPEYRPAGFWLRTCATILDWFVVGTVASLTSAGVLLLPMLFVYYIAMWGWKGTSLGGMVMNTKLVRDRGRPINFAAATVRSIATIISTAALGLGFAWSAVSRTKKSWHDHIAGTNVVRIPEGAQIK